MKQHRSPWNNPDNPISRTLQRLHCLDCRLAAAALCLELVAAQFEAAGARLRSLDTELQRLGEAVAVLPKEAPN